MKTNKTTLSFTKEEIAILSRALNTYALEQMNTSKTWANPKGYAENGYKPDIWGEEAINTLALQARAFAAQERLEKKDA